MKENMGLFSAQRLSDGKEVVGFFLRYGKLFGYIVEKDSFYNTHIDGEDETTVTLKLTRIMENTLKPVD